MNLQPPHSRVLRHSLVFRISGLLMLVIGIGSLALGPLEMVCFTWFEEGGRFAYEGFGFGSFMFGNMAMQILGYYMVAAVLIPLGYGHLTFRRWIRTVMPALTWCWVVLGVPLLVVLLFVLLATKELTVIAAAASAVLAVLSYCALPVLLIRFYRSDRTQAAFDVLSPPAAPLSGWVEALGVPVLVVLGLETFFVLALHVLLFFNGLFPLPGGWATGMPGYVCVDVAILTLLAIAWGTVRRRMWAWWGGLAYFAAMTGLWVGTLMPAHWAELLETLAFPPYELGFLDGIPVQGWHFAVLVGLPLSGTLVAIVRAYDKWTGCDSRGGTACVEHA